MLSIQHLERMQSFRPSPAKKSVADTSGMLLLLEACDALAANPLLADNCPEPFSAARSVTVPPSLIHLTHKCVVCLKPCERLCHLSCQWSSVNVGVN